MANWNEKTKRAGLFTGAAEYPVQEEKNPKIISGTKTGWQHKMRPSPSLSRGEYLRWLRKKMKMARKGGKWTAEDEAAS